MIVHFDLPDEFSDVISKKPLIFFDFKYQSEGSKGYLTIGPITHSADLEELKTEYQLYKFKIVDE
jgi:hypothetical protein